MLAQFPGSERTFVKVAGGSVTGGNVGLAMPAIIERNAEIAQRLFDTRKSALQMARVLSFGFVVRLITGRLRTTDVEDRMERMLNAKCAAIYTRHASIGADVDKPVDVVVTERVLSARESGTNSTSAIR
jgi:hypothetical protein